MKYILTLLSLTLFLSLNSQICLGTDEVVCVGQPLTIQDCLNQGSGSGTGSGQAYDQQIIPYNADPLDEGTLATYINASGNVVHLIDDRHSDTIPIGFNFCYWGNSYDKLLISSNNYITFHLDYANIFSPWQLQQGGTTLFPLPLTAAYPYTNPPINAILGPWQDIYPNADNYSIKYKVWGTAPYRRLSISWYDIPMFSCTNQLYSSQIIIYETTNIIETHILDKPVCNTWNSGLATHGLINSDGTSVITTPNRNCTVWTTSNEGYRFTPNDVVLWASTDGQTYPYNNGVLNVVATTDTIGYFLKHITNCSGEAGISDTSWVYGISTLESSTPVSCTGLSDGTATAELIPSVGNITYLWNDPSSQTTSTAINLPSGTWECIVESDAGCIDTLSVFVGQIPPMISNVTFTNPTCNSINNGIANAVVTSGTPPYTFNWSNSTSTTQLATDLGDGLNSITITDNLGCVTTNTFTMIEPVGLSFIDVSNDLLLCVGTDTSLYVTPFGGSSPYIYSWVLNGIEVGTDSLITLTTSTNETYYITLSEECGSPSIDTIVNVSIPVPPQLSVTPDFSEQCTEAHFELYNTSSGNIDTTWWIFSNGITNMELGFDSTSIDIITPGTYSLTMNVITDLGCKYGTDFNNVLKVDEVPVADFTFSSNPTTFFETTIDVTNQSSPNVVNWMWYSEFSTPSISTTENTQLIYPQGEVGNYLITLSVFTEQGCMDTITKILQVISDVAFYAPNVFTPNGDEHNQTWDIIVNGIDIQDFNLKIFNRWGEMVWETKNPNAKWDGTYGNVYVNDGIYYWTATMGNTENDGKYQFSGAISVVR